MALLWPEADEDRARHSLTQAMYAARRALHCPDLLHAGATIRLNDECLTSDVQDLEDALGSGDLELAASLYQGPFLDGFHLSGSPDFEQWASVQRQQLETRMVGALETLASASEASGELGRAIEWRRRLVALRPLDSAATAKLMQLQADAGDRAGALQLARVHEVLLREQLDLPPDPAVVELTSRLREPGGWESRGTPAPVESASPVGEVADTEAGAAGERAGIATAHSDDGVGVPTTYTATLPGAVRGASNLQRSAVGVWIPTSRARIWRVRFALAGIVLVLLLSGVLIERARRAASSLGPLAPRQRVVVAPFRVAGADQSLSYLRDGMVELLSTRLADDTTARSVDAGAVLGAWRAAGLTTESDAPRADIVKLALRLGAERIVTGSVVGSPSRIFLHATVLAVPTGEVNAEATVAGPADSLPTLIDRLAARLLAFEAGEDEQFVTHTTASLPALRAYLAGQSDLRRIDYAAALRNYEEAVRRDSTFALAALHVVVTAERLLDDDRMRRGLRVAWAHRAALGARDRALLESYVGPRYPDVPTMAELRAAWQQVVDLAPNSAESWFALGSRLYHTGIAAGVSDAADRAGDAFRRALSVDGSVDAARGFLVLIESASPSVSRTQGLDSLGPFSPFVRWRDALARGDAVMLRRVRDSLSLLGPANLRAIAMASQTDGAGVDDGARALAILAARPARADDRLGQLAGAYAMAVNRGHRAELPAIAARLAQLEPGSNAASRLSVLGALYGDGDTAQAAASARELAALTGTSRQAAPTLSETWVADACVVAQWRLSRNDTSGVSEIIGSLRSYGGPQPVGIAGASGPACAALLDGWRAVTTRGRAARTALAHLDSLVFTPLIAGDLASYAPLLLARLHERVGDDALARRALERRAVMLGWPRYQASILLHDARLASRAGDVAAARAADDRYLALRGETNPSRP